MKKYTAVVLGGTGLVGSFLINELLLDENCIEIKRITRRKISNTNAKIKDCIIDFNSPKDYNTHIKGDVLFSCLGTTLSQAGSKENQYQVDYNYQLQAAKSAIKNNIPKYILISSPWANIKSKNYYRKMKAELEEEIKKLSFKKIIFIKPNGLLGKRKETRLGEKFILPLFKFILKLLPNLNTHIPIEAEKVAKSLLNSYYLKSNERILIFSRLAVLELSNKRKAL